jgi:hypothetical protein
LSIRVLFAARCSGDSAGRPPSDWRAASQPVVETLRNWASESVTPAFQELYASLVPVAAIGSALR